MDVKSDIYFQYPFPIAVTFHNADNTREPVEAHDRILKLFEVTLKYLASIMICEYLEDGPDDPQVNRALGGLARRAWVSGTVSCARSSCYQPPARRQAAHPGLYELYTKRPTGRRCARLTRCAITWRTATTGIQTRPARLLRPDDQYRNKTAGHGVVTEQLPAFNEPLLAACRRCSALRRAERPPPDVRRESLVRGKYTHEFELMGPMRSRLKNAYVASDQSKYRIEDRLYLCPPNDDTPTLCLHPLMIAMNGDVLFLNESARDKEIEYLSYQTGQIKRPDRLMEDFKEILGAVMQPAEGRGRGAGHAVRGGQARVRRGPVGRGRRRLRQGRAGRPARRRGGALARSRGAPRAYRGASRAGARHGRGTSLG
jgi:hypothetical protein